MQHDTPPRYCEVDPCCLGVPLIDFESGSDHDGDKEMGGGQIPLEAFCNECRNDNMLVRPEFGFDLEV